ncbi:hypothetical protein, partial [uncultured Bifidobacterium sp.]|uniref:hypothetical protein n=1 Tax=uncultured Bifidobacterium sp. TaxID=165187 RepID=UPI00259497FE
TLSPPEPKTYTVDIPGGDGVIDLTQSLTGDVAYKNRQQEFPFMVVNPDSFERVKTDVSNFLHGKSFDYQMTMDPGYTYHGRFTVNEYSHALYAYPGLVGMFTVSVDADPYKLKGRMTYQLNATGGKMFRLESGRKPVHPVIECTQPCRVRWKDVVTVVPVGTYRLNDVLFTDGFNEIYINSRELFNTSWADLGSDGIYAMTWDSASSYRWDDIQRMDGNIMDVPRQWSEISGLRWEELANKAWADIDFRTEEAPDTSVYLSYDWKDL